MTGIDLTGYIRDAKKEVEDQKVKEFQESIKDWNKAPQAKEHNVEIVNRSWHGFLTFFFILFLIALIGGIIYTVYLIKEGKFQSTINTVLNPYINNTTNNQYDFNPLTTNEYSTQNNYTIVNNINCPTS